MAWCASSPALHTDQRRALTAGTDTSTSGPASGPRTAPPGAPNTTGDKRKMLTSRSIWAVPSYGVHCAELPLVRSSVIARALTWKRLLQPSSRASTLLTGCSPWLLHASQVYRRVPFRPWVSCGDRPPCRGFVGFLWGWLDSLGWRGQPARAPGYSTLWVPVITLRVTQGYRTASQSGGNSAPGLGGRRAHG